MENQLLLNYEDFVALLALCAFDVVFPDPEPSPMEKVVFIISFSFFSSLKNFVSQMDLKN
jgi:hypothetical protein